MSYCIVFSTTPSLKEARILARHLLDSRLAACVNISSQMESHYVWKGKREKSKEFLLLIKTKKSLFKKLSAELRARHSYETPEIIAVPIQAGSKPYLDWVGLETE